MKYQNHYNKKYFHLTWKNRIQIKTFFEQNFSIRKIAKMIGVSASTISRELKRNTNLEGQYLPDIAQYKYNKRKWHKYYFKFSHNFEYEQFSQIFVEKYDKNYFGIKATYNYIQTNYDISSPSQRTIFNWIKTNKWILKKSDRLRQYYKKGGKRKVNFVDRLIPNKFVKPIWARPKHIDLREEYGHWEADLIIGKRKHGFANILTIIERKTRVSFAKKVLTKDPFKINQALRNLIKENKLIMKTLTIDNGIEFEKIGIFASWENVMIYRAEPYASFQRGSNEHLNGLVRRKYKKGFDFNQLNNDDIDKVMTQINLMPREILNWKNSWELFQKYNK